MSPHTTDARRLRRLSVLAIGLTTAVTLTACSSGSDTGNAAGGHRTAPGAHPTPTGVVTVKAASDILDAYEQANNRSNKVRDAELLATVESGQLNAQSRADYQLWKTWSKKKQTYYGTPFRYAHRTYMIPPAGAATWFAVRATATGDKDPVLLVFDKVGGTYKMTAAVYTDGKTPIPKAAVDRQGFAAPADPAKPVGTLAPTQLSAAFEDLVETGGKKTGAKLASTQAVKSAIKLYTDRDKGKNSSYATTKYFATDVKVPKVYALRLAGGGVLAVFPTAHTQETMLRPQYMSSYKINPNKEEAVYSSTSRVVITDDFQGQGLATLTPSGKPQIIGRRYQMVDSR